MNVGPEKFDQKILGSKTCTIINFGIFFYRDKIFLKKWINVANSLDHPFCGHRLYAIVMLGYTEYVDYFPGISTNIVKYD